MKNFKFPLSILLVIILIVSSVITVSGSVSDTNSLGATNRLSNSSFEDNSNWSFGGIYRSSDKSHSGSYSAKSSARGQSVMVLNSQNITVKQNTDYILNGYIYRGDNSTWAYIDMNDIPGEVQLLDISTFGKWQYVCGVWNSGNRTNMNVRLVVEPNYTTNQHLKEGITGDVWFDDISLEEITYGSYSETPPVLSSQKKTYALENKDISVSLSTDQNKEYVTSIKNKNNGYSWINEASLSPLPQPVENKTISWNLVNSNFDNSKSLNGTGKDACHTLTLTYTSNSPNLTLKSYWKIYDSGPLYHYSEIVNNTGSSITYRANDISSADIILKVPDNSQVYQFNRSRYNNCSDGLFTTGIVKTNVNTNMFLKSVVENSWLKSSGFLPFELIQSNNQGFYIGYEWSYGEMLMRTQQNKNIMRFSANLGYSSDTVTKENGESLTIPPVFFGAYTGDSDAGSNNMKKWFYNHFITASLRENANEPAIEFHLPLYRESDLKNYINSNDIASYGAEVTKMDYWWTVPGDQFDDVLEQKWLPDNSKWPNGMTYGKLIKQKFPNMKTSLYMCDTYMGVDIGTKSGQQQQISALTQRMKDWQIDYWRSDFDLLKPNNYSNHEGLMNILDTMIGSNKDFRYEHCSAGGSLKDFATLQRMTFMTMEDSGGALNHRMAFYSNSYMINPVQLKFDLGFDWTSDADSGYIYNNRNKWTTYNVRTAMMGAMMVQNVSSYLSDIEKQELIKGWKLYKEKQRPILKGADVYHILPMPDGKNWDGMEYYNKDIEKGSVFLFRDKNIGSSDGSSKTIKLKGLEEKAKYKIEFQDRTEQNTTMTGSELINTGITVRNMNSVYDSEILWITKEQDDSIPGDVNNDKTVDIKDASLIQKYVTRAVSSSEINVKNADIDKNGRVDISDATYIQKLLAGLI